MAQSGFRFDRRAKRGILWTDGISTVMSSFAAENNHRSERNMMADIKRAILKRAKHLEEKIPPPAPKTQIEEAFRRFEHDWEEIHKEEEVMALPPTKPLQVTPTPQESEVPQVPELFLAILTDPFLSDSKKVRMLTAYLED